MGNESILVMRTVGGRRSYDPVPSLIANCTQETQV